MNLTSLLLIREVNRRFNLDIVYLPEVDLIYVNDKTRQTVIKWKDGTTTHSTCHENDEFDIQRGFRIAFLRKVFKSDKDTLEFIESKLVREQNIKDYIKEEVKERKEKNEV